MELNSCLYQCSVMHHRLAPKVHHFQHDIFMFYLDLDELDTAASRLFCFSRNRANLYAFRDDDHLPSGTGPLKTKVIAWLARQGVTFDPRGRIQLLTLPRVLGYIFNPISVYFCFDPSGTPLCAIAEVGNTFGEMKLYLVGPSEQNRNDVAAVGSATVSVALAGVPPANSSTIQPVISRFALSAGNVFGETPKTAVETTALPEKSASFQPTEEVEFRQVTVKNFYVSPFSTLDLKFDFKLRLPGEKLDVRVDDWDGDEKTLITTLTGRRAPLTNARLNWFSVKYPLVTLKVIFLIHWHALLLWRKRIPFYRKAGNPSLQTDVLRPYTVPSPPTK